MVKNVHLIGILLLCMMPLVVTAGFEYDNPTLPKISSGQVVSTSVNNNTVSVNNSYFWNGLAGTNNVFVYNHTAAVLSISPSVAFKIYTDTGNSGTAETQVHAYTVAANKLASNGYELDTWYLITSAGSATATSQYKVYWNNVSIYDTGALNFSVFTGTHIQTYFTRENATAIRATVVASTTTASASPYVVFTLAMAQNFTGTNVVNVTVTRAGVGASSNDILLRQGGGMFVPA